MKFFHRAFSLIEVMLALGLLSFCLVALLGLCTVGLKNGRKAGDDTVVAAVLWQEVNAVRQQGPPVEATNAFYDIFGQPTNGVAAYYECSVEPLEEAGSTTNSPPLAQINVTWPASVPAGQRPHTNTVVTTVPPAFTNSP